MKISEVQNRSEFPKMIDYYGCKIGLEIGVHVGHCSYHFLKYSKLDTLFGVDPYMISRRGRKHMSRVRSGHERIAKATLRLDEFGDRHILIRCTSHRAVKMFPDEYFDFIHVDGAHKLPYINTDLDDWYPKCKIGGIFTGHDFKPPTRTWRDEPGVPIRGVWTEVNRWLQDNKLEFYSTTTDRHKSFMLIKEKKTLKVKAMSYV